MAPHNQTKVILYLVSGLFPLTDLQLHYPGSKISKQQTQ